MEPIFSISVLLLAFFALFTEELPRFQTVFIGLIAICLISATHIGFTEGDASVLVLSVLGGIVSCGMLIGLFFKKHGEWIALLTTALVFIIAGQKASYFGFEIDFSGYVLMLPLLGAIGPLVIQFIAPFLSKFAGLDQQKATTAGNLFYLAVLVFFAQFQAQYFGVILVAAGWLAVALSTQKFQAMKEGIGLLSLGFLFLLMKTNPTVDDSFLRGNFIMGLLVGIGAISWVNAAKSANKLKWPLMILLPFLVIFACVWMGKISQNFGGIPTYIGVLLGATLLVMKSRNFQQTIPFLGFIIAFSSTVLLAFKPVKEPEMVSRLVKTEESTAVVNQEPDVLDVPAIQLVPSMSGSWKSVMEASKTEFQLGPEGAVTNGGIQDFKVKLKLNAEGQPQELSVEIPTAKVTTYDPMRDKSVLGASYLNAIGFPKMGFSSTSIVKEGDVYRVSGNFELLGKKSPMDLKIKFAATGTDKGKNFLVMVGKATLDRTKFGMKSDAKIGDLVNVTFEVEFRK